MTTPEWNDPFQTVPGSEKKAPVPLNAPPPTGPQFGAAPVPGDVAWSGAATAPPPDWQALQPWKRKWRVTMRRWGYGWLVGGGLGLIAAYIAVAAWAPGGSQFESNSFPFYVGYLAGGPIGYVLWVGWWLDHVLAAAGARTVLIVHTVTAAGLGMVPMREQEPWIASWYFGLLGLVITPLVVLAASRVKGSFESGPQPDEDLPWGQGPR